MVVKWWSNRWSNKRTAPPKKAHGFLFIPKPIEQIFHSFFFCKPVHICRRVHAFFHGIGNIIGAPGRTSYRIVSFALVGVTAHPAYFQVCGVICMDNLDSMQIVLEHPDSVFHFNSDNILPAHDCGVEYCVFHSLFFVNVNQAI